MKKAFQFSLLLYLFLNVGQAKAQDVNHSINVSILKEHTGIPWVYQEERWNPGFTLAYERGKDRDGVFQSSQIFQLGYYYHKDQTQAYFLSYKGSLGLRFGKLINVHLVPGIGFAHSFGTKYEFILENDQYLKKRPPGQFHVMPSLGLGLGLHLDKFTGIPLEIYTRYEASALIPYAELFNLNTMGHIGFKYTF